MNENNSNVLTREEVGTIMMSIYEDCKVVPKEVQIASGADKGDGYLSFLTRVDVTAADGAGLHVMIKCAPRLESMRKFIPMHDAYLREIRMYEAILPAFEKFQKEHAVPEPFANVPRCLKTQSADGKELLVLENIRTLGFQLWDRMKPMDLPHIALVFTTYGKLHAISYAMRQQQPETYAELTRNMFDVFSPAKCDAGMHIMIQQLSGKLHAAFAGEPQHAALYEKLRRFKDGGLVDFWNSLETNLGQHPVLRHGDCWVNNMMFKYDDPEAPSRPTNIRLLDFQLARTGSPVLDLSNFLYVSAPKKLLDQLDDLLTIYHSSLMEAMKTMHCDMDRAMTFEQLKGEWREFSRYGFLMSMILSRAMMREKDEVVDLSDITDDNMEELMGRENKHEQVVAQKLKDLSIHMHENEFLM